MSPEKGGTMKTHLLAILVLATSIASTLTAKGMVIEKVFMPDGFDKNDIAQVVVQGHFTSGCYQYDNENITINGDKKEITININYHQREGGVCIQMISPFTKTIGLGRLLEGNYKIKVGEVSPKEKLNIKPTNSEDVDDFIYAPVEFAEVNKLQGSLNITMKGRYPLQKKGCMRITDTVTTVLKKDIIVIQPIAELKDDQFCNDNPADENFTKVVSVPNTEKGLFLVYVRALNGGSYSRVFDIK